MAKKITTVTTTVTTTEEMIDKKIVETHYLLILDKSGSMSSVRDTTISSFNEQVQTIRALNKQFLDQKYFLSLISFNHNIDEVYMDVPADQAKEITLEDYRPEGNTALLDAMGYGISRLEDKLRPEMNNSEKIVTAVVVIMTDGEENSSREWKENGKIKKLIERLNKDDRWTISYVGANQDAILNSREYGIYAANTVNYKSTNIGTAAVSGALINTMNMRASNINVGAYSFVGGGMGNSSFLADFAGNIDEDTKSQAIAPPAKKDDESDDKDVNKS
jgi:uncharacterized protein YegL